MMKRFYIAAILLMVTSFSVVCQSLEEDINIIYMKANVLYDSGRYDESVRMYNRVLNMDENYHQAYVMRAKAKFALGAYKGTKKDINSFVDRVGVTKTTIKLMALTEIKLKNFFAADNYLKTSLELDPYDAELYRYSGEVALFLENKNLACEQWSKASNLGDNKSVQYIEEHCDIYIIVKELNKEMTADSSLQDSVAVSQTADSNLEIIEDGINRDAFQELKIDEELTLIVGNGLGERRLEEMPEIFMLSNQAGRVVVDICIDGTGKVQSSAFNRDMSSLYQTGIISLAIRKSRDFQFFPSFRTEQCGSLIFVISPT